MCEWTNLIVNNNKTPFTNKLELNQKIPIPIANGEGRYFVDDETLQQLKKTIKLFFHMKIRSMVLFLKLQVFVILMEMLLE